MNVQEGEVNRFKNLVSTSLGLEHMVSPSVSPWITITNPSVSFSKVQSFMLCCIKISFLCHIV